MSEISKFPLSHRDWFFLPQSEHSPVASSLKVIFWPAASQMYSPASFFSSCSTTRRRDLPKVSILNFREDTSSFPSLYHFTSVVSCATSHMRVALSVRTAFTSFWTFSWFINAGLGSEHRKEKKNNCCQVKIRLILQISVERTGKYFSCHLPKPIASTEQCLPFCGMKLPLGKLRTKSLGTERTNRSLDINPTVASHKVKIYLIQTFPKNICPAYWRT